MLSENAILLLCEAFKELLSEPEAGHIVFTRSLAPQVCCELAAHTAFQIPGWQVAAVVGHPASGKRQIPADQAVAWREDKGLPLLLLVDTDTAGAGMDGIYNAAREITEAQLFKEANELARSRIATGFKVFARQAIVKARQASGQKHLAPWLEFTYLCEVVDKPANAGHQLSLLGLWPMEMASNGRPDPADLDKSARLAERLLPLQAKVKQTPEQRVEALRLPAKDAEAGQTLAKVLRDVGGLPRAQALNVLATHEAFRLGALQPQLFDDSALQSMSWVSWRGKATKTGKRAKPLAWSGLGETPEQRLELRLLPEDTDLNKRARLEVRWNVAPDTLAKGAIDYQVQIYTDQDVLVEKRLSHSGKPLQKVVFTQDDFELEDGACFEPRVVIRALTPEAPECFSEEDFVLCFGEQNQPIKSSAAKVYPSLSLAAAALAPDEDTFKRLARAPGASEYFGTAGSFITCRVGNRVGKVFSPALLTALGQDWVRRHGELGRWQVRVRTDGTRLEEPRFISLAGDPVAQRLQQAASAMAEWVGSSHGPTGLIYHHDAVPAINEYALAAMEMWRSCDPALTLIQTLEVVSQSGEAVGLVVLPLHPLRVAWQQSFDLLVVHHRYRHEPAQDQSHIQHQLSRITGAHYPSFLPGVSPGGSYVFADTLGFHAVAMVRADDPEPKATVALLARLLTGDEGVAPSVGQGAADALAGEVGRYLRLHPAYRRLKVHALRAGDAMTVVRALGQAVKSDDASPQPETEEASSPPSPPLCVDLDLFPAQDGGSEWTGRFLALTQERRRTGAGAVPEVDRWLLEAVSRPGGVSLPRLRWARRTYAQPDGAAHMAMAFDVFHTRVELRPLASLTAVGTLEAHGLMLMPTRNFETQPCPHWLSYIPADPKGAAHPFTRVLTVRQVSLHASILRATARHLGGSATDWPVLYTEVSQPQVQAMERLHQLCDWVVTADRNAGIEYFDSPNTLANVYAAYIIDCAPERDDLGFIQLITSTSRFEEVQHLLSGALSRMGLAPNAAACGFMLGLLKGVSGRLALRLAEPGYSAEELVALAMIRHQCLTARDRAVWLSLSEGFLIPLDDVPELFGATKRKSSTSEQRADLLYVRVSQRGGLKLSFIEVKYRRQLDAAMEASLVESMHAQGHFSKPHLYRLMFR